jgi:hypothetical protein
MLVRVRQQKVIQNFVLKNLTAERKVVLAVSDAECWIEVSTSSERLC